MCRTFLHVLLEFKKGKIEETWLRSLANWSLLSLPQLKIDYLGDGEYLTFEFQKMC